MKLLFKKNNNWILKNLILNKLCNCLTYFFVFVRQLTPKNIKKHQKASGDKLIARPIYGIKFFFIYHLILKELKNEISRIIPKVSNMLKSSTIEVISIKLKILNF